MPELSDRDKTILIAERVMGWLNGDIRIDPRRTGVVFHATYPEAPRFNLRVWIGGTHREWNPFEFIADAFEVEAALPEDQRESYIGWLQCEIVSGGYDADNPQHEFALAHATPPQRMDAVIAVLTEGK